MTQRLLVMSPYAPWPARAQGLSLRYFPILDDLKARWEIDLVVWRAGDAPPPDASQEPAPANRVLFLPIDTDERPGLLTRLYLFAMSLLPWRPPASRVSYGNPEFDSRFDAFVEGQSYEAIIWLGSHGHRWIGARSSDLYRHVVQAASHERVVADLIDSPSLALSRRTAEASGWRAWMARYELFKLKREERAWRAASDTAIYISPVDANFVNGAPACVIPNGVFIQGYTDGAIPQAGSPTIGFLGDMAYPPNVGAVRFIADEVFDALRQEFPTLEFWIIGRRPTPEVRALAEREGIVVTGEVDDIWPYVNAMDVMLLPMWSGAGQQNKVLESMFAGRAVVTTSIGNGGVRAADGEEILLGEDAAEIRAATARLLADEGLREQIAQRGRDFVMREYGWASVVPRYEALLRGESSKDSTGD